ncbi:hypothetical protein FQN57_004445 [Myotisia sp. PD_48]|nr:hypothetical protein FQN57_004445 [Myotisia sp. PD_48]
MASPMAIDSKQELLPVHIALETSTTRTGRRTRVKRLGVWSLLLITVGTLSWRLMPTCSKHKPPTWNVHDFMSQSPLIDTHNDWPIFIRALYQNDIYQKNFTAEDSLPGQVDFPRLQKGLLDAQFWSLFVGCPAVADNYDDKTYHEIVHDTFQQIDLVYRLVERFPKYLIGITKNADDVFNNFDKSHGRISSLMGIEGLHQIGNSPSILRMYYNLGVRYATLTHVCHNQYADSERPARALHGGLSAAGRELVLEMNRIGMMVDLSHTSADTQRHVLTDNTTRAPVIFSHSNAFGLCKHTRNAPDDVLQLLKLNGGVIMVTFLPDFVNDTPANASLSDVADHIVYIGKLIGYDHVGLGSDFDGMGGSGPRGLEDVSKYPDLVTELHNRGISDNDIQQIMGLNLLRVMKAVEQTAASLSTKVLPLQDKISS